MPATTPSAVGIATRAGAPLPISIRPDALQGDKRLAHCRAADAEAALKVALRGKPVAGLQRALQYLSLQMGGHLLEEFPPVDDCVAIHQPFIPSCLTTVQQSAQYLL